MELRLRQTSKVEPKQKLSVNIKIGKFFEQNENEFAKFIIDIENTPLFQRLMYPSNKDEKIISYRRFPNTDLTRDFYVLNENILPSKNFLEIEPFLENYKDTIDTIKRLGLEKFKKYFLFNESISNLEQICSECNLHIEEVKKINDFINEISIHTDFYSRSTTTNYQSKTISNIYQNYHQIATITKNAGSNFMIYFSSPKYAQGRYIIDYDKLKKLKQNKKFTKQDLVSINKLLKNLELINVRKSTIYQILQFIINKQRKYLSSGDVPDLKPLKQIEAANEIGVHPSIISRAIYNRSVVIENIGEKPIKYFFPNKKYIIKNLVEKIITDAKYSLTDYQVKHILENKFNITISRRSINQYRNELKLPSKRKM